MSIVSRLIANPDAYSIQMLQRGVQAGTIPPYIGIPLIQQKLQQQKETQGIRGLQTSTPPRPVADQVMQAAQAEQIQTQRPRVPMGIDELPSNLPTEYAHGGIVAFQQGGNEGDPTADLSYADYAERLKRKLDAAKAQYRSYGSMRMKNDPQGFEAAKQNLQAAQAEFDAAPTAMLGEEAGKAAQTGKGIGALRNVFGPAVSSTPTPAPAAPTFTATTPAVTTPAVTTPAVTSKEGIANILASVGLPAGAVGASRSGLGLRSEEFKVPGLPKQTSMAEEFKTQFEGLSQRAEARRKDEEARIAELEGKVTGKAFEGLEKDLRKESEGFGADKEQAKYMAMFKAGLAMMAGTSRHGLENIGKGALVGAEDYQKAAGDIKKAEKENRRAMALIEQARREEERGKTDRAIARLTEANKAAQRLEEFGVSGLMAGLGVDQKTATDIWSTQYQGARNIQGALIAANASILNAETSGRYGLAGQVIAAQSRAGKTEALSAYEAGRLRMQAEKQYTIDNARQDLASSLGFSTIPKNNKWFEDNAQIFHQQKIYEKVYGPMVLQRGNVDPYAGFKLVP